MPSSFFLRKCKFFWDYTDDPKFILVSTISLSLLRHFFLKLDCKLLNYNWDLAEWSNSQNDQAIFISGFLTPNVLVTENKIFQNWRKQETTYQGGTKKRNAPSVKSLSQIKFAYLAKRREKNPFPKRQPPRPSLSKAGLKGSQSGPSVFQNSHVFFL